jgi:ABC-type sugar transport system permease subunit
LIEGHLARQAKGRVREEFPVVVQAGAQGGPASQMKLLSYLICETGVRFLDLGRASAMSCIFLIAVFLISLLFLRALHWARTQTGGA